jgi:hypothetical protein
MYHVRRALALPLSVLFLLTCWCGDAHAQGSVQASTAGAVRDSSGAVVPGVTVEAASPVLIEKSRSAITDDTGRYRIVGLTPGTYTLTFALQGFNTVKREDIVLGGSLTATIDVEMRVGSLEETVTVRGESPIVDVQSAKQQRVIGSEIANSIPGSRNYHNLVVLVPGLNAGGQNVGGINGPAPLNVGGHGGGAAEGRFNVDGLGVNGSSGGGTLYVTDTANASEVTIDVTGGLGEAEAGGRDPRGAQDGRQTRSPAQGSPRARLAAGQQLRRWAARGGIA